MPKISPSAKDQTVNDMEDISVEALRGIVPYPIMMCGVTRKVNIGNFENIDVYNGIAVPIMYLPTIGEEGMEEFKRQAEKAADIGFSIVSEQTGARYNTIKELQSGE